jgi:RNA polymerase-binding transcription factor DksA
MVTSHAPVPMAATAQRPQRRGRAAAPDSPSALAKRPGSMLGADPDPDADAIALVWDLTAHRLYRAFAECLAAVPQITQQRQAPTASMSPVAESLTDVRLAATRHAVNEMWDTLRRMAAGSYGVCERCDRLISAERLRAAPTTRWCATC